MNKLYAFWMLGFVVGLKAFQKLQDNSIKKDTEQRSLSKSPACTNLELLAFISQQLLELDLGAKDRETPVVPGASPTSTPTPEVAAVVFAAPQDSALLRRRRNFNSTLAHINIPDPDIMPVNVDVGVKRAHSFQEASDEEKDVQVSSAKRARKQ